MIATVIYLSQLMVCMKFRAIAPTAPCEHLHWILHNPFQFRIQRPGGGREGKKHEIYVTTFGSHPFYDLFSQGQGGHSPLDLPPGSATG